MQVALKQAREHHLDDIIGLLLMAIALDKDRRLLNLSGLQLLEIKPAWIRPSLGLVFPEDEGGGGGGGGGRPRAGSGGRRKVRGHQRNKSWDYVLDRIKTLNASPSTSSQPSPRSDKEGNDSGAVSTGTPVREEAPCDEVKPSPVQLRKLSVPDIRRYHSGTPIPIWQDKPELSPLARDRPFLQTSPYAKTPGGNLSISDIAAVMETLQPSLKRQRHTRPLAHVISQPPKLPAISSPAPKLFDKRPEEIIPPSSDCDEPDGQWEQGSLPRESPTNIQDADSSDEEPHAHAPSRRHESLAMAVTGARHTEFSALDEIRRRSNTELDSASFGGDHCGKIRQLLSPVLPQMSKVGHVSPRMIRRAAMKSKLKLGWKTRSKAEFNSSFSSDETSAEQTARRVRSPSMSSIKGVDETDSVTPSRTPKQRKLPRTTSSSSSIVMEGEVVLHALDLSSNGLTGLYSLVNDGMAIAMRLSSLRLLDAKQNRLQNLPESLFQVSSNSTCCLESLSIPSHPPSLPPLLPSLPSFPPSLPRS